MAADLVINFRVGGNKRSTADQDPNFIGAKVVDLLREKARVKGLAAVQKALIDNQDQIVASISADAGKFAASAARVFTRVKSPTGGTTVSISLDGIARSAAVFSNDKMSARLKGKTTVEWRGLRTVTMLNKRRRQKASKRRSAGEANTFFVDSGDLRKLLIDHLGPAMALMVDPKITIRTGPKKVTVGLSLLAQASGKEKAGVTNESLPQAYGGAGAGQRESLFVRYLKKAGAADRDPKHPLAYKLENPRGVHRPFLQNTLVYWISNRLPLVLDKSVRTAVAKQTKKAK